MNTDRLVFDESSCAFVFRALFVVITLQQQNQLRERVFTLSHKLSAMSFGQDRYRRRYWVLPKCGGIFVEGLESGEPESADPNAPEVDKKIEKSVDEEKCFKPVTPPNVDESTVSMEQVDNSSTPVDAENEVKTEDLTVQSDLGSDKQCAKSDLKSNADMAVSSVIKQENGNVEPNSCSTLKAELVSLNCLIGDDVKMNGDGVDVKNGFVDLKNCIRSDIDCVKVEPLPLLMPSVTVSDTKQVISADSSCADVKERMLTAEMELLSASVDPPELALSDSVQSIMGCKHSDDQLPRTPSKDDASFLQHSAVLRQTMLNAGLAQADSQCYSIASSSQRTSQVATPSSEICTTPVVDMSTPVLDMSVAGTPVNLTQPSRASTPGYLSTSIADDLQLSADGELQPDYLAVPQNVQPISLGNLLS